MRASGGAGMNRMGVTGATGAPGPTGAPMTDNASRRYIKWEPTPWYVKFFLRRPAFRASDRFRLFSHRNWMYTKWPGPENNEN